MLFTPNYIFEEIIGVKILVELENITNFDRKTIKSWLENERTPRKQSLVDAFDAVNEYFENRIGINPELSKPMLDKAMPGPPWQVYFENPLKNVIPNIILPETQKLILSIEQKTIEQRSHVGENKFEEAVEFISGLNFPNLNFEQDILESCKKAKNNNEFMHKSMIFYLRTTMYCLASFDAEYFSLIEDFEKFDGLGEMLKKRRSYFNSMLPDFKNNKSEVIQPIEIWFEQLKKRSQCKSWESFTEALGNNQEINIPKIDDRQIRRYKKGKVKPDLSKIKKIVKVVLRDEDEHPDAILYYGIAKIFQHLYDILIELVNVKKIYKAEIKDVIEFFQEYNKFIDYFLKKYTAPIPQR